MKGRKSRKKPIDIRKDRLARDEYRGSWRTEQAIKALMRLTKCSRPEASHLVAKYSLARRHYTYFNRELQREHTMRICEGYGFWDTWELVLGLFNIKATRGIMWRLREIL